MYHSNEYVIDVRLHVCVCVCVCVHECVCVCVHVCVCIKHQHTLLLVQAYELSKSESSLQKVWLLVLNMTGISNRKTFKEAIKL